MYAKNLLIVIADGEHARFVRADEGHVLHTVRQFDSTAAHKQDSDLMSDHPGAAYHSDSTAHHALAPRHDPHALAMEAFARYVAEQVQAEDFGALVLAAPAHSLDSIRERLDSATRARLVGTLHKDLVKTPDHELHAHVQDWVPPEAPARHLSGST